MSKKNSLDVEKVNNHIVTWLKNYAQNAKVNGFVVGISGGIDSAVTSTLCAQTGMQVLCIEMPIHQVQNQVDRGREHIKQLSAKYANVSSIEVDLSTVFDDFKKQIPSCEDEHKQHLALANSRSRLRMTTLYYLAGIHGLLVAGTGNKVEDFGVGFYTKYGDGGVDLSPIADLLKSDVYALGAYLKVPQSILEASPTDGLFGDDRTDEDQLGATYDELESAMLATEKGAVESDFEGREKEVFAIYKRLHAANQHKMKPIPVCTIQRE